MRSIVSVKTVEDRRILEADMCGWKQILKNPVREIRMRGSVGVLSFSRLSCTSGG